MHIDVENGVNDNGSGTGRKPPGAPNLAHLKVPHLPPPRATNAESLRELVQYAQLYHDMLDRIEKATGSNAL